MSDALARKMAIVQEKKRKILMLNAQRVNSEMTGGNEGAKRDQKAIDRTIADARKYNEAMREEEKKAQLRTRIDGSPSKSQKSNTIANFVGEIAIPAKIRFAMYDKAVQTGDENLSEFAEEEAPPEPAVSENPQPFRSVSVCEDGRQVLWHRGESCRMVFRRQG
eukprot:TRINITY_DN1686_c0_g1_i15.p5 TRINITY_DN1686_c0_g1~~TRINITY_DN1686_c0_g1_i15.p5  ORF type:complete len:164 (+),score=52.09 TRINITY_DN1686_c0_g1_i15:156-647(+)